MDLKGKSLIILNLAIILSLLGLYMYIDSVSPIPVPINECSNYVGEYVTVKGVVIKSSFRDSYSFVTVTDEKFKNSIHVFVEFNSKLAPGEIVKISGIVVKHGSSIEIQTEKKSDVKVISDSYFTSLPVIMENPAKYVGLNVDISGRVTYLKVNYLNITDKTGNVIGYVRYGYEGAREAYFCGEFKNNRFLIKFATTTVPDGFKLANISELENHSGKVCVHGRIADYGLSFYLSQDNYSLRVYADSPVIISGMKEIIGEFQYDDARGEYLIYAKTVK